MNKKKMNEKEKYLLCSLEKAKLREEECKDDENPEENSDEKEKDDA